MFSWLSKLGQGAKKASALRRALGAFFWFVLEIALVIIGFLFLLFLENVLFRDMRGWWPSPRWFSPVWLPVSGLALYLAIRIIHYAITQYTGREEFPDIEDALEEGLAACEDARIDPRETPLFLVLGLNRTEEKSFGKLPRLAGGISTEDDQLPLHFRGNRDAIWITLRRVSALAMQTDQPLEKPSSIVAPKSAAESQGESPSDTLLQGPMSQTGGGPKPPLGNSMAPATATASRVGAAVEQSSVGRPMPGGSMIGGFRNDTLIGGDVGRTLSPDMVLDQVRAPPTPRKLDDGELDWCARRLNYLGRRLRELRGGLCPINGLFVAIPYSWLLSNKGANLASAAESDLIALQAALGVKCSLIVVFTGIAESEGFTEYLSRLNPAQLKQRLGCGFPAPSLYPLEPNEIDSIHDWIVDTIEAQSLETMRKKLDTSANGRLIRLLTELRSAKLPFRTILGHLCPRELPEPFYFSGVYFASVTNVDKAIAPFFSGALDRLLKDHDSTVAWTDEALDEESDRRRWLFRAQLGTVVLSLASLGLSLLLLKRLFRP